MKKHSISLGVYLLAFATALPVAARENFKLIRLHDEVADGTGGKTFLDFSTAVINDPLDVAYLARLNMGGGVTNANNDGIWMDNPAGTNVIQGREADVAPGTGGAVFTNLINASTFQINDEKVFALRATLSGVGVTNANDAGIWQSTGGGPLTLVAREGDVAPGTGGAVFTALGLPAQDNSTDGNLFFKTRLTGAGVTVNNDTAIYGYLSGVLTLVVREGDVTPVLAVGASGPGTTATFGQMVEEVTCSDDGTLIFTANYNGIPSPFLNSGLLIRDLGTGTITPIMQENDPLPDTAGAPTAALINGWETFGINDSDELVLRVNLRFGAGGVGIGNNEAIISDAGTPGTLRLLAREGDVTPEGGNTHFIFRNVFIGNSSAVGIGTTVSGNVDSIYSAVPAGALINVAKEGTAAAGVTSAPAPTSPADYLLMSRPAMNHDGDILFTSTLTMNAAAPAVDVTNNAGLWRTDGPGVPPSSTLGLISRKGDIEDDLCATIIAYDLNTPNQPTGGVSGSGRAINDTDNLVVNLFHSVPLLGTMEGVYILDNLAPVFCDPPANELRNIVAGTGPIAVSWVPPTVVDDNDPAPVVVSSHMPGDLFSPGVTVVTYTATDFTGNVSTYRFRVIVTEIRDLGKIIASPGILAQNNDPAPPSFFFRTFSRVCLNSNEDVVIEGGTTTQERGVWSNGGGAPAGPLLDLAITGDTLVGATTFKTFFDPRISDRGRTSFGTKRTPATSTTDSAIVVENLGATLSLAALEGDGAPGSTGIYRTLFPQAMSQASTKDAVFYPAHLQIGVGGVGVSGDTGIWYMDANGGGAVRVVTEGSAAPIPGLSYGNVFSRVVTGGESEDYAYAALVSGPGVTGLNNEAMFRSTIGGSPELAVREADTAKGPNEFSSNWKKSFEIDDKLARRDTGRFQSFLAEALSPNGEQLAYHARLKLDGATTTLTNSGIWKVDAMGEHDLVVREGHQAPGFVEGVCFDRFDDILIDDDGWVTFRAWLRHDTMFGIDSSNDGGIWTNQDGFFRWVAHEGQLAPNTDGGIVLNINSFSHFRGGMAAALTLSVGTGDVLFNNNFCMVSGFDGITGLMEINLREGDQLDNGNPTLNKFTTFSMDIPYNPYGGSGGLCTPVQGGIDRMAFKASFTGNSNAVLVRPLSDVGP